MSRRSAFWRHLLHRDRIERDLDAEIGSVFTLLVDEKIQGGMRPAEARRAAALELGGVEPLKAQIRDARSGAFVDTLRQDIRYAARSLRAAPGFTFAVVATLTIGIAANTTIFTLLDAVIFKPLPVPSAGELVTLYENAPEAVPDAEGGTGRFLRFSYPRFERLRQALGAHGSLAAVTRSSRFLVAVAGSDRATPVRGQMVSGGYFSTLGISAARGRLLTADDVRIGQPEAVAVISDAFWQRSLQGSRTVVGQTILVNGLAVTVVGVTPRGFVGLWTDAEADVWLPITLQMALRYQNNFSSYGDADRNQPWLGDDRISWLNLVGRIKKGELPRAGAALRNGNQLGLRALTDTFADAKSRNPMLAHTLVVESFASGFSGLRAPFKNVLFALAGMVVTLLLVTCANIANLLLARAAGRARDVGIRISLGATTGRLIRQNLTESLMLAALGGTAGVLAGEWLSGVLAHQVLGTSGELPAVFSPDARVTIFAAALSAGTALLFGLAPALRTTRFGREASVPANQRHDIGRSAMRGMRPLVAVQLALSVGVVFAALLLGRTLVNFMRLDPGFAAGQLASASFSPDASGYSRDQMSELSQRLVTAAENVRGVASAATSVCGLLANCSHSSGFRVEGVAESVPLPENWVGPHYFSTTGIPLVGGRDFNDRDTNEAPRVAIITESIARRYFPDQSPLGRRLGFSQLDTEIVGVVRDARTATLHAPPVPMVYLPIDQPPPFRASPTSLEVRVVGDPGQVVTALRDALRRAEPRLSLDDVTTLPARLARDFGRERIVAYLAAGFALVALLLASLGLYGVLAYAVARRAREIGVRMALGARPVEVVALVIRDALTVVGIGVLAGVGAALGIGRLLRTLLFDVSVTDPFTFALVLTVLAAVTVAAAYVPARRAARVDPVLALRSE